MRWWFNSFAGKLLLGAALVGGLASIGIYFITVALHSGSASPTSAEGGPREQSSAPVQYRFASQLQANGATACLPRVEELGDASMQGVTDFAAASNWFAKAPDARILSAMIGMKYGTANLPYGFTGIFAAPAPNGRCDGFVIQVLPSQISCADLQRSILERKGKVLGNLAGVPLLQDSNGEVALVPTAANACVLIGLRVAYSE